MRAFLKTVQNFFKGLNEQFQAYFKKDLKNAVDFFNFINQGDLTTDNLSFLQAARLLLTYYPSKQIFNELYDGYAIDMLSSIFHTQPNTDIEIPSVDQQSFDNTDAKFFIFQKEEIQHTDNYGQLRNAAKAAYADLSFPESIKLLVINPFIRPILGLKELYASTIFNFKNYAANDIRKLSTAQATLYFVEGFLLQIVGSLFLLTVKIWNSFKENFEKFKEPDYFLPLFEDAVNKYDWDKLDILFEEKVVQQEWITNACQDAAKNNQPEIVEYLLPKSLMQVLVLENVFISACNHAHTKTLTVLIESPALKDIISSPSTDALIMTLLKQAVEKGDGAIVEALLKHNGISHEYIQELIKMMSAANSYEHDTIRFLLQEKLDLKAATPSAPISESFDGLTFSSTQGLGTDQNHASTASCHH